jgi:hypothetical protein
MTSGDSTYTNHDTISLDEGFEQLNLTNFADRVAERVDSHIFSMLPDAEFGVAHEVVESAP